MLSDELSIFLFCVKKLFVIGTEIRNCKNCIFADEKDNNPISVIKRVIDC